MKIYHAPNTRSVRIVWLCEELGLDYQLEMFKLGDASMRDPEYLKIHPMARVQALADGEVRIFESGAILQYLGNKTGRFYPRPQRRRSDVEQWLFWQMAGLGPMAGQAAHFRNYKADKIAYAVKRYTDEVIRLYNVMNSQLAGRDFLASSYSIADMACWPWIRGYKAYGIDLTEFEHLRAWFKRVGARPAVRRAADIGKEQFIGSQARAQSSI